MGAVTLDAAVLSKAMKVAASIVESRQTIPILANVRLTAPQGAEAMEIVTSDLDVEFRQSVPLAAPAVDEFATTVDARRLSALVASADRGAQVSLKSEGFRLAVQSGRSRWNLHALPAKDFPIMPVEEMCVPVSFEPASAFARAIDRVVWASVPPGNLPRAHMQGVYVNDESGKVRLTSLDGQVLAVVSVDAAFPAGAPPALLGCKFARTLASLCSDTAGEVTLAWDDRKARAEIGGIVLTGKLIDSGYVEYRRAVPAAGVPIIIDAPALLAAIRRVQLIGSDRTAGLKIDRQSGALTVSANVPDNGDAAEEVPAECPDIFASGFNGQYLTSMLDAIGGETIEIHQENPGAPALIRRVVDDGAFGVVMPMRV